MQSNLAPYIQRPLNRRRFLQALAAAGISVHMADKAHALDRAPASAFAKHDDRCVTVEGTGGRLMVEQLKASGVSYVFGNPGSTEVGFYDALAEADGLNLILGLHEGIVVAMAHGYAQVTSKPACVNVHAIVGTAQIGGQLYNAHRDRIPMIVTAGLVDPNVLCDDVALAPRPGFEQVDINKQFTKQSWEVRQSASIPMSLRRAFKIADTAPTGPVYLAVADYALTDDARADIVDQTHYDVPTSVRPNAGQIQQVARQLLAARHPMLVTGPQLLRDDAVQEAVALSDMLAIPVTDLLGDFIGGSGFPTQHPLFYPRKALNRRRSLPTPQPLKRCDLLIGLDPDTFFPDGASSYFPAHIPAAARSVAIGLNTDAMARTRPVDIPVMANIKEALTDLMAAIRSMATPEQLSAIRERRFRQVADEVQTFRNRVRQYVAGFAGRTPMHPEEVAMIVDNAIDPDAITVHENFSHDSMNLTHILSDYGPETRMRVANSGSSLGWGIGAAIGAKLGKPDRQVVLNIGDGATMYSAAGFWTMARYEVPVLNLIWNNQNYQTVRFNFDRYGGYMARNEEYVGMYLGTPDIDFAGLSASQGVAAERATTPEELQSALQRGIEATRAGRPYTVEIRTSTVGPGSESTWHQDFKLAR